MTNYIDLFLTEDNRNQGSQHTKGFIYSYSEETASRLIQEGKGIEIDVGVRKSHVDKVDTLLAQLREKVEAIRNNDRLTDEARREDIRAVVEDYRAVVDAEQEKYEENLETLKNSTAREIATQVNTSTLGDYEIQTQTGLIKTDVTMAHSFTEAMQILDFAVRSKDEAVLRNLLSQFHEIKGYLSGMAAYDDKALRSAYDKLREATTTSEQKQASTRLEMYDSISNYRRSIKGNFDTYVRSLRV